MHLVFRARNVSRGFEERLHVRLKNKQCYLPVDRDFIYLILSFEQQRPESYVFRQSPNPARHLKLVELVPKLYDNISFGLYSVANSHFTCYQKPCWQNCKMGYSNKMIYIYTIVKVEDFNSQTVCYPTDHWYPTLLSETGKVLLQELIECHVLLNCSETAHISSDKHAQISNESSTDRFLRPHSWCGRSSSTAEIKILWSWLLGTKSKGAFPFLSNRSDCLCLFLMWKLFHWLASFLQPPPWKYHKPTSIFAWSNWLVALDSTFVKLIIRLTQTKIGFMLLAHGCSKCSSPSWGEEVSETRKAK